MMLFWCMQIKNKFSYRIAHYPVHWTVKELSTLPLPPSTPVHSDTNSACLESILAMQQLRAKTNHSNMSTTVNSQVLIYTAEWSGAKIPNLRNGSQGVFEPGLTWLRVRHATAGLPLGYRWATAGLPLGYRWATAGLPLGYRWATAGLPLGYRWATAGLPLGYRWATAGLPLGYRWATAGLPLGYRWATALSSELPVQAVVLQWELHRLMVEFHLWTEKQKRKPILLCSRN